MIPCEPKGEEAAAAFPIMEDYNMTFTAYAWIFEEFYKVRYNGGMIEKFCVFFSSGKCVAKVTVFTQFCKNDTLYHMFPFTNS